MGGKVWKGEKRSGPAPARHIPWPEVFKHHISVVEGHTKMLEMVQKHTVQGTGNYDSITNLVKRGYEMLRQAKDASRSFIPPKNQREMVPLGSSSASMYPGYSPADIEYGKAADEVGQAAGELKAQGLEWELPANGPEYKIGQGHGEKRKMLFKKARTEGSDSDAAPKGKSVELENEANGDGEGEGAGGENPYFVIDTNPTPVTLPTDSRKRLSSDKAGKKEKKKKTSSEEKKEVVIETEDITAEVDARLKAKEEKARAKAEKKRRRESTGEDTEKVVKKSKKDRPKKREVEEGDGAINGDGEERKKKRRKNKEGEAA